MAKTPIKVWSNFEDGAGFLRDYEGQNGFYYAEQFIGLKDELRLAPLTTVVPVTVANPTAYSWFMSAQQTANNDSGTANAAVTTTNTTLTDTREAWTVDEHVGSVVTCNSKTMLISSNTATTLTGGGWSGGSNPGAGNAWTIGPAPDDMYIYGIRRDSTNTTTRDKISGRNADFGTVLRSDVQTTGVVESRWVRYKDSWHAGRGGGSQDMNTLTTVAVGAGIDSFTTVGGFGVDISHLVLLNMQMARYSNGAGVSILKVGGTPTTVADWGTTFECGDTGEPSLGIASTQGQTFVLNKDGLYSFNAKGRSGLIQGFGGFKSITPEVTGIEPWGGGIVFSTPPGLLYYEPGSKPINISVSEAKQGLVHPAITAAQDLSGGRYHGIAVAGDYIYTVFQPDLNSTTYMVLWGQPAREGDPSSLRWQVVKRGTLDTNPMLGSNIGNVFPGIGFIGDTYPTSSSVPQPVLLFSDGDDLAYTILDRQGAPILKRSETALSSATTATVIFSELFFSEPVPLDEIVVYTEDMAAVDSLQISVALNGSSSFIPLGAPIILKGRDSRRFNDRQPVYRMMMKFEYTTTAANPKLPLAIKRIELYGP